MLTDEQADGQNRPTNLTERLTNRNMNELTNRHIKDKQPASQPASQPDRQTDSQPASQTEDHKVRQTNGHHQNLSHTLYNIANNKCSISYNDAMVSCI